MTEVVLVEKDRHTQNDFFYRSRHQHVAELVFNQVLPSAEDKYDLLATLIQSINIDYSSDRQTLFCLIRGRNISNMLPSVELGRLLYEKAEVVGKNEPFVAHQRAVFELHHPHGSLAAAEQAAARAAQLNPKNRSIRHTQAEIARRQATETDDPLKTQSYRKIARAKLSGEEGPLSEYDLHTRAKVAIDELRELIMKGGKSTEANSSVLVTAVKEAEMAIQNGRSEFPENAEMLAAEADFRDLLNQAPQALALLERAFRLNPRQDWLAIRLAKRYAQAGEPQKGIEVIQRCLKDNPEIKFAHFTIAQLLVETAADQALAIDHLRRSFTRGDNNFESQFWFGRQLFLARNVKEADTIFTDLSERAPGKFRTNASAPIMADGRLKTFEGAIERKEEGYAFATVFEFGVQIFASRAESGRRDWDMLRTHSPILCSIAFNRKGPRLTNITVRRQSF